MMLGEELEKFLISTLCLLSLLLFHKLLTWEGVVQIQRSHFVTFDNFVILL